jgi:hypothetical protein
MTERLPSNQMPTATCTCRKGAWDPQCPRHGKDPAAAIREMVRGMQDGGLIAKHLEILHRVCE